MRDFGLSPFIGLRCGVRVTSRRLSAILGLYLAALLTPTVVSHCDALAQTWHDISHHLGPAHHHGVEASHSTAVPIDAHDHGDALDPQCETSEDQGLADRAQPQTASANPTRHAAVADVVVASLFRQELPRPRAWLPRVHSPPPTRYARRTQRLLI
jgi:hypothetical protein